MNVFTLSYHSLVFLYTLYLHHLLYTIHINNMDSSNIMNNRIILSLMVSMLVHLKYNHTFSDIYWSYLIGWNYLL